MYKDDTSRVTRRESLGSVEMESSLLRKCVVSLMYDGSLETSGFRMLLLCIQRLYQEIRSIYFCLQHEELTCSLLQKDFLN